MTPKEKAEELVDKIYYCQRYADGEDYIPLEAVKRAKQCALVAVNEIINSVDDEHVSDIFKEHWQQVKQEIKKL
jgi:hypothetical protein